MVHYWQYVFPVFVVPIIVVEVPYVPHTAYRIAHPPSAIATSAAKEVKPYKELVREVNEYEVFSSSVGVPIEYWYNETSLDKQYLSSPGCPQSIDGYPWVYYKGLPGKCFLVGFKGPCPLGHKITLEEGSPFGVCACECFVESKANELFILPKDSSRYLECPSPNKQSQVFDKQSEKCYAKKDKGPCSDGELISGWTNHTLTCLPICDSRNASGELDEMEKKGLCILPTIEPVLRTGTRLLRPHSCPDNQRFSQRLKMCIYQRAKFRGVG